MESFAYFDYADVDDDNFFRNDNDDENENEDEEESSVIDELNSNEIYFGDYKNEDDFMNKILGRIIDRFKSRFENDRQHICTPACLFDKENDDIDSNNPYLKPMKKNFARILVKSPTANSLDICYVSPCGQLLVKMEDIQRYLLLTNCMDLTTINFTFSKNFVLQKLSFDLNEITLHQDISNGIENLPIVAIKNERNGLPFNPNRTYIRTSIYDRNTYEKVANIVDKLNQCGDNCSNNLCHSECQCAKNVHYRYKRLFHFVSDPLRECTSKCKCSKHCANRVVSLGIQCEFQIFYAGLKGWGVRPTHFISKGTYVFSYVGELCHSIDHNAKQLHSDEYTATIGVFKRDSNGLLWLDQSKNNEPDTMLLEGLSKSNLACYVNHSCSPNLFSQLVIVENELKQSVPTYALFAICDIKPFEELSWDYHYSLTDALPMDCCCGSANCNGVLR